MRGKHDVAFIGDACCSDQQMARTEIGYPRQDAIDTVTIAVAVRLQVDSFDAGEVLDRVGHAASGEQLALPLVLWRRSAGLWLNDYLGLHLQNLRESVLIYSLKIHHLV